MFTAKIRMLDFQIQLGIKKTLKPSLWEKFSDLIQVQKNLMLLKISLRQSRL